jgi:ribonuclease P protein component
MSPAASSGGVTDTDPSAGSGSSRAPSRDDGRFTKNERLVKTKDFGRVYRSGASVSSGPFVLKILSNALPHNRIGFSISARSVKRAVKRNRVRRLFRESFRKNKRAIKQGFDLVLVVRREPQPEFSYEEAKNIYLQLAGKAGILI